MLNIDYFKHTLLAVSYDISAYTELLVYIYCIQCYQSGKI